MLKRILFIIIFNSLIINVLAQKIILDWDTVDYSPMIIYQNTFQLEDLSNIIRLNGDGQGYQGTNGLVMDWQVRAYHASGGWVGYAYMYNDSLTLSYDDYSEYQTISFRYNVQEASTETGSVHFRLILRDGGQGTGSKFTETEIWVSHHYILDDSPGWHKIAVPLKDVGEEAPLTGGGFWNPGWGQTIAGNDILDLDRIAGWIFEFAITDTLYQAPDDSASGILLIDELIIEDERDTLFVDIKADLVDTDVWQIEIGDYDSDSDFDFIISYSQYNPDEEVIRLYQNTGNENFTLSDPGITSRPNRPSWGDYDNDADLDLLWMGWAARWINLYRNDAGSFSHIDMGITADGAGTWGDYDNDGDLDLLQSGVFDTYITKIYRNENNTFSDPGISLPNTSDDGLAWGDYDNDGDLDVLLSGWDNLKESTKLYRNDNGEFIDTGESFTGVQHSSVAWGDYDTDGDLDFVLAGLIGGSGEDITKIYRNDNGSFTDIDAGLVQQSEVSVAWGDYDNDGDFDLLVGNTVYQNIDGKFGKAYEVRLPLDTRISRWFDYDKDGDLDIIVAGNYWRTGPFFKIYRNEVASSNSLPSTPNGLDASVIRNSVNLSWNKSNDNETAQNGLTYNLRIGTSSNGVEIMSPMSMMNNGQRKIIALGNTYHNNSWTIKNLAYGTYYWNVQAIDNGYAASTFASQTQFQIVTPLPPLLALPADGSVHVWPSFDFNWSSSVGADSYRIQVATDTSFSNLVINQAGITGTSHHVTGLVANSLHYWRVRAENTHDTGDWSERRIFRATANAPVLSFPSNGASGIPLTTSISWNTVTGASSYTLQLSMDVNFSDIIISRTVPTTTESFSNLDSDIRYFWRVRATNTFGGVGPFSEIRNFYTVPSNPTWHVRNTGTSHAILIEINVNPDIQGDPLQQGDYIGVFYDSLGTLACAGYAMWSGSSNVSVTAWGDDSNTPEPDGFGNGEEFTWRIWRHVDALIFDAVATYHTGSPFTHTNTWSTNGLSGLASLRGTTGNFHQLSISKGWSILSSYVSPDVTPLEAIYNTIIEDVIIVKNGSGQIFWPQFGINTIGEWNIEEGYLVKLAQANTLDLIGVKIIPQSTPISIPAGWSLIGYLRDSQMSIETIMSDIENDVVMVKDGEGNVYWPEYSINQIGDMIPGEGYQIKMLSEQELTYPANESKRMQKSSAATVILSEDSPPWKYNNTGVNHVILILQGSNPNIKGEPLKTDDFIGVFYDSSGILACGGYVRWVENENNSITVWGDDGQTSEPDGFADNEKFIWQIWRSNDGTVFSADATYLTEPSFTHTDSWGLNGISGLASLTGDDSLYNHVSNNEETILSFHLFQNYPNPFNPVTTINYQLPRTSHISLIIYNNRGQKVATLVNQQQPGGYYSVIWDAGNLASGVYFYRIEAESFIQIRKMLLMK